MVLIKININRSVKLFLLVGRMTLFVFFIFVLNLSKLIAVDSQSLIFQTDQIIKNNQENTLLPLNLPLENQTPSPSIFYTMGKILFALVLIITIIYLTLWGLKVIWERRGWARQFNEGKPVKVLTSLYLAPQKAIFLVEVGRKILILGLGREEINCLDIITLPEEIEALKTNLPKAFQNIFNRELQKQDINFKKNGAENSIRESTDAISGYLNNLKNIIKVRKENVDKSEEQ